MARPLGATRRLSPGVAGSFISTRCLFATAVRMAAWIPAGVRFVRMSEPDFGIQMGYRFAVDSQQ